LGRIFHAAVEHVEERVGKAFFDLGDFLHGERTFVELSVLNAAGDDFIDQFVDVLGGNFFERTAGGFDGIGEEDDGAFAELRFGAVVAVGAFADFFDFDAAGSGGGGFAFANLFLFGLVVKILDERSSVVLANDVHDDARKLVFY